jgi:ketosteroid isomerase-like protein
MWYDIFAIQFLYGANNSYHTGNDVYTYRENEHYWETIWDAGGNDTINYIGSVPAKIDLRDGYFSDMGLDVQLSNNKSLFGTITIFRDVIIENAYGGSGDDTLQGNNVNNFLDGYLGTDTAIFDGNRSNYKVSKTGNNYTVSSVAEGTDTLTNIEFLQFKDGTFVIDSVLTNDVSSLITTDDYAGNTTTIGILTAGSQVTGNIELINDADWFKVSLQAGSVYLFELTGFDGGGGTLGSGTLHQPYLSLYDTNGVWTNSTSYGGTGGDPLLSFTPIVSGNYYLGVEELFTTGTGTYTLKAKASITNHTPTGTVSISGTITLGQILTASNTLTDIDGLGSISYQWLSNGDLISGANQTTYTLTATDTGNAISVKASYTDLQGTAESVTSSATKLVTAQTDNPIYAAPTVASEVMKNVPEPDAGSVVNYFLAAFGAPLTQDVSFYFRTLDGTATAGTDYLATEGQITLRVSENHIAIPVTILGDTTYETDETFSLEISNPVGFSLPNNALVFIGTHTITNNDFVL